MTVLGLSVFGILTADNLRRASSSLPVVALHGWVAMASLLGLMALAVLLIADFAHGFIDDPDRLALGHVILAVFGFMGMLVFGFSHVLIPMFALSRSMPANLAWSELALTTLALLVTVLGALSGYFWLLMAGAVLGLVAVASYLWLMRHALKTRMRKRLGLAFVLVRISWAMSSFSRCSSNWLVCSSSWALVCSSSVCCSSICACDAWSERLCCSSSSFDTRSSSCCV